MTGEVLAPASATAHAAATTVPTIHAWGKNGTIPAAIREGRVVRFRIPDVLAALEERAHLIQPEGGVANA
jgi:hypothetical protein